MITGQRIDEYENSLEKLYLSFNVDKDGKMGDTFVISATASSSDQITNGAQYLSGQYETIYNNNIVITAARTDAQKEAGVIGIETVGAYQRDYDYTDANGVDRYNQIKIADIDMASWCNYIKGEVVGWLQAHDQFDSTAQVFALDTNDSDNYNLVSSLSEIYCSKTAANFV